MKRKWFFVILVAVQSIIFCDVSKSGVVTSPQKDWEFQVEEINKMIHKLTNRRNLELAKAARAQDQGDRLQFIQGGQMATEAKQYWQRAQNHRENAAAYQKEIDKLEFAKTGILNQHGVKYTPPKSS